MLEIFVDVRPSLTLKKLHLVPLLPCQDNIISLQSSGTLPFYYLTYFQGHYLLCPQPRGSASNPEVHHYDDLDHQPVHLQLPPPQGPAGQSS